VWEISKGCVPVPIVRTRLRDNGIKRRMIARRRKSDSFQFNNRALSKIVIVLVLE